MSSRALYRYVAAIVCCAGLLGASAARAEQVVVYSARIEQLIKPMFDAFTKDTGIGVKFVTDKEGALLARLKAEGKNTPADMLITTDAGNLWEAAREGLLRPVESKTLEVNIPAYLRDLFGTFHPVKSRRDFLRSEPCIQTFSNLEQVIDGTIFESLVA